MTSPFSTISTLYQTFTNSTASRVISVDDDTQASIRRIKTDPTYSLWSSENYKMLDRLSQPTVGTPVPEENERGRLEMFRDTLDESIDKADKVRVVRCKAKREDYERVKGLVQSVLDKV
ncbi:hypothetical protein V866_002227 [Kwoniella sp. B9012]